MTTIIPEGIFGITGEKFSNRKTNIEVVEEMIKGGVKIIQYREKEKKMKEKFAECCEIRKMTKEHGVIFIVNDEVDLAVLTDADGVHLGQDDLPILEARKLIGNKIMGLSTHSKEQAQEAVKLGADYIGAGPIFKTLTKEDAHDPVGLEYLDYLTKNIEIPVVAIGGIKEQNIRSVIERGAKRVALISEIVGAENIVEKIKRLEERMSS